MSDTPRPVDKRFLPKKNIDWGKAEALYRAGQLSVEAIGVQVGCSETLVRRKAKKEAWAKDLHVQVQERVRDRLVRDSGAKTNTREPDERTDSQIVEDAAESALQVVRGHRAGISGANRLMHKLFAQLESDMQSMPEIEDALDQVFKGEKALNRARQAVSLQARAQILKDLSTAMVKFQSLERVAWGLNKEMPTPPAPLEGVPREKIVERILVLIQQTNIPVGSLPDHVRGALESLPAIPAPQGTTH